MFKVIKNSIRQIKDHLTSNNKVMKEGKVKFYNATKGFGFIKPAGEEDDVFVHRSGLIDEIREDDNVRFDVEKGPKGLNAINVEVA